MMFGQPQASPAMFGGAQMNPQLLQMLMQKMQQGGGMPGQMPQMGQGPSSQMNPLASILGNQGGATSPQGQMQNGSAMGGNGMGGLMQIINAMKSQQQVNGAQPPQGSAPGGLDIAAIIRAMQGGGQ